MPKLNQLRSEKRVYLDYQKNESEMERLNRLVVAAEYDRHAKKLDRSNADQDNRKARSEELQKLVQERNAQLLAIDDERLVSTAKLREVCIVTDSTCLSADSNMPQTCIIFLAKRRRE
jgi:chromosome segregation ATPase